MSETALCYPVFKFTKQSDIFNVFRLTTELQCVEHAKDHDNKFSQSGLVSYKVQPVGARRTMTISSASRG